MLELPGGRLLVGAVGLVVFGIGLYLGWRATSGGRQDSQAALDAAPRETHAVHVVDAVGNAAARGAVVVMIGVFIIMAAFGSRSSSHDRHGAAAPNRRDNGQPSVSSRLRQ